MASVIADEERLEGATYGRFGEKYALPVWDEGFGPLWVYFETLGPVGVVRAKTWEEAWECVVDEIMADVDDEADPENFDSDGNLAECLHYRGCGTPSNPQLKSMIAAEDPNGSRLVSINDPLCAEWGIEANVVPW